MGSVPGSPRRPLTVVLLEAVTPAEVVAAVVEHGSGALGAWAGLVALVTPDGAALEIVRTRGFDEAVIDRWRRVPLDAPLPLCDVVRSSAPLLIANRAEWEARYPDMVREAAHEVKASAALPLVARGRTFGALHFSFPTERSFGDADRALLEELARQCALALDRALLIERAEAARAGAEAAGRRLQFLARASALLSESLDPQAALEAITALAVPDLCDWAAVDLAGADGGLERLSVAHVDPAEVGWVREAQRRFPIDMGQAGHPIVRAITAGATVFLPEVPVAVMEAAAKDEEHLRLIRRLDLGSFVCAPLTARSRTFGAVTFATTRSSGRAFSPDMVALAEELARRGAVAVDNARLYVEAQRATEAAEREAAERAGAERRAERVAADLRLITDAAPLLISYVGADLRYRFVNQGYADWFSLPAGEMVGSTVEEVVGAAAFAAVKPHLLAALAGERVSYEAALPFDKGRPRHIHADYVPDRGDDGAVRGVVAVIADITARREAEEEARARREEMAAVFERVTDAFCAYDHEWRYTFINPAAEKILGRPREELIGQVFWDAFPAARDTPAYPEFLRAVEEQVPVSFEMYYGPFTGWFEVRAYPSPSGLSTYFRDITGRKRAEAERQEEERRERFLSALTEHTRSAANGADPEAVLYEAARLIGEHTAASRSLFGEVEDAPGGDPDAATITVHRDFVQHGAPSIAGMTRPLLSFGREIIDSLRAGRVTASEDILNDRRVLPEHRAAFAELNIRAFVGAPIHRDGRWVSLLVLHHPEPRPWPADERELLAEVAERARLAVDNARLQRERARADERLRLAAAAAGLGAWEIDLTGREAVSTLDGRCAALFGRAPEGGGPLTVVGAGWADWLHPDDRDRVLAEFAAALSGADGEFRIEYRAVWPDGVTARWLSALATVQRDGTTGRPLRVVGMCRDTTDEKEASLKQRRFLREMLFGLTEGRLRLCDTAADLPAELAPAGEPVGLDSAAALRLLRKRAEDAAESLRFTKERTQDLLTAAAEAAKNAVRHAGGGVGSVHAEAKKGVVQVWIQDAGGGIAEDSIHRAVEQGWTTGGFGAGFYLMRQTCDRVYLLTGPTGTTVVLEMDRSPAPPTWLGRVGQGL